MQRYEALLWIMRGITNSITLLVNQNAEYGKELCFDNIEYETVWRKLIDNIFYGQWL